MWFYAKSSFKNVPNDVVETLLEYDTDMAPRCDHQDLLLRTEELSPLAFILRVITAFLHVTLRQSLVYPKSCSRRGVHATI